MYLMIAYRCDVGYDQYYVMLLMKIVRLNELIDHEYIELF